MDRAAFAAGHGWPVGKTPAARSAPSRSEGAAPRVCSLWLLSLAQARESDSAARKADETHRDVSRFSRSADNNQKQKRWAKAHPINLHQQVTRPPGRRTKQHRRHLAKAHPIIEPRRG